MNHIHRLQTDNAEMAERLAAIRRELSDLTGYLTSEKFHEDTTVQTRDVLTRLRAAFDLTL